MPLHIHGTVRPRTKYFTSQTLKFLIFKMEAIILNTLTHVNTQPLIQEILNECLLYARYRAYNYGIENRGTVPARTELTVLVGDTEK